MILGSLYQLRWLKTECLKPTVKTENEKQSDDSNRVVAQQLRFLMKRRRLTPQKRFKSIGGRPVIELNLKSPHQLFDERDPAPFRERDLDDDAVHYILSSYRELPSSPRAKLSLYFATMGEFASQPSVIGKAIRSYFEYESISKRRELRFLFKEAFASLFIGLCFLLVCTYFSYVVTSREYGGFWPTFAHEGLMLMGWYAMWHPINTFLYEWWPLRDTIEKLDQLSDLEVEINEVRIPVPATEADTVNVFPTTVLKTS